MINVIKASKMALIMSALIGSVSCVHGMEYGSPFAIEYKKSSVSSIRVTYEAHKEAPDSVLLKELQKLGDREEHFLYTFRKSYEVKHQKNLRPLPTPPTPPQDCSVRGLSKKYDQMEQPVTPTKTLSRHQPK